ncbi:MAG TPA: hypothetical protein VGW33_10520 [Terriglobia bacterium]|nr:hypothetical protein [Terriglobia bacterium]
MSKKSTEMELIKKNLSILEDYEVLSHDRHNEIMTALEGLQTPEPTTFETYSASLSEGLPAATQGVIDLYYATESGDPFAISVASVGIFQGFLSMAGPMLGPVGPLASALSGMMATILAQWLPTPPSLQEEVEELLNKFQAQEKKFALGTAADQIWRFLRTLERSFKQGKATAWQPLNLQSGTELKAIDDAWQWLSEEKKQSLPYWGEMLSKTCEVFTQLLRAVAVANAFPSKIASLYKSKVGEDITPSELMNVHLQSACELFLLKSRLIKPVVQNRGVAFHLSAKGGGIWAGDHIEEGTNAQLDGNASRVSVAVSRREAGSADPVYHVLRVREDGKLAHRKLSSPYVAYIPLKPSEYGPRYAGESEVIGQWDLVHGVSDVWGMVGGDKRLDTDPPFMGVRRGDLGPEKNVGDRIYFYAARTERKAIAGRDPALGDLLPGIIGYLREENGEAIQIYERPVSGPELKWVRVVQGPRAVAGDPDDKIGSRELPGVLRNIDYLVYGGCQSVWNGPDGVSPRGDYIYVDSRRSPRGKERVVKDGFVRGPWGGTYYYGLGVDQRYVWVHAPLGFACATHASVMRCLEGNLKEPTWMFHYMGSHPHFGKGAGPKGKIVDLCPCDDGSLLVSLTEGDAASAAAATNGAPLYTAAYHVNLKSRHIAVQRWTRCGGGAASYRSCKVPLFCWPQLEGLIEFVEETYPDHAKQAHTH